MITQAIVPSVSLDEARERFLDGLGSWAHECVAAYRDAPPTDGHDQLTYTTGWEPYLAARPGDQAAEFMTQQRDRVRDHFVAAGRRRHGYWAMQEAHHGTEHFELFLGALSRIDPGDAATKAHLLDAAEHVGNWSPDVPDWLDGSTGLFRSLYFGAEGVRAEPGFELNMPDHLRLVNVCLLADRMAGAPRYLDLAARYAGRWADAIVASGTLPVGLLPRGPVYALAGESDQTYRAFVGMVGDLDDPVERAENILASGGVDAFVALWERTGRAEFRRAAERVIDVLATQVRDPDAGAAADAIRTYRRATGDARYDAAIEDAMAGLDPFGFESVGMGTPEPRGARPAGIGKRSDALNWFEDGAPRRHSPVLLAVAAETRSDAALATRALDLASTYFALAREALPDGRRHGCAARTVSAIARGHGRENNTGMATGVLRPLMEAFPGRA